MHTQHSRNRIIALLLGIATLAASGWAFADPPWRVARLAYIAGSVSFSPAGENDWVQARVNWPLTTGDRLWTDRGGRAELQVGGTVIRMGENTSVTLLNLDNSVTQVQLEQGTLNVRARQIGPRQSVEVATPNLAFTTRRAGNYRIEVNPADDTTAIVVRSGQGEVYGERAAYAVDARQSYRFAGTGLRNYDYVRAPRVDEFERWAGERDRRAENSSSARYVSRDMIGYEDLDANGSWRNEPGYGNVWVPNRVATDWTPYRDGHWAWVDPWGWTWVDDAPWGFAPSHYGRWANVRGTWSWVPGPSRSPAVYAPALVAFVGGLQLTISSGSVGGVAWFPLGPRDVYRPAYPVSRGYFDSVNRNNTTINNTTITNVYNNTKVTNVYANRQVQGAVVAVPATAFVQSQPVSRAAVRVPRETITSAPVSAVAAVAPIQQSVRGAAPAAAQPPARAREQRVVARSAPPAARAGFAAQQKELAAKPGTPLATSASSVLKPAAPVPAPTVVVVAQPQAAPPTARPPAKAPDGKPEATRDKPDDRKTPAGAPVATPQASPATPSQTAPAQPAPTAQAKPASPQAAAPSPAAQPPQGREKGGKGEQQRERDQGGNRDQGSKGDRREKPAATPPAPAQSAPTSQAPPPAPPKPEPVPTKPAPAAAPAGPAPAAAPAKPEPAPTPAPKPEPAPAPAPKPEPASPQAAPPAQAAQPPQGRDKGGKGEQQREREQGGKSDQGSKGDRREKPAATPPAPAQSAPAPPAGPRAPEKPAPAPAAKKADPTPPAAAPQSPQPRPQPDAVPGAPKPKPEAGKREDRKKDDKKSDGQQKREEEDKKKQ